MVRKILCFLDFHVYDKWKLTSNSSSSVQVLQRSCNHCNSIDERRGLVQHDINKETSEQS